jgi:hypothetical protein
VNGRKVNIPSYNVKPGDIIEIKAKSRNLEVIKESLEKAQHRGIPPWLELDAENMKGKVLQCSFERRDTCFSSTVGRELYSKLVTAVQKLRSFYTLNKRLQPEASTVLQPTYAHTLRRFYESKKKRFSTSTENKV